MSSNTMQSCYGCPTQMNDGYTYHGCVHLDPHAEIEEYFPSDLLATLKQKLEDSTPPEDYIERIIYNYFFNIKEDIDTEKVLELLQEQSKHSFYYIPIVLFILEERYKEYFVKQEQL